MSAPSHFLSRVVGLLMVTMLVDLDSVMPLPRIALFRGPSREWVFDSQPSARRPTVAGTDAEWIAIVADDVFEVEATTVPDLLVELVSRIQRRVMDVTGDEWPEVYTCGGFAGLARPVLAPDGQLGWSVLGEPPVPFGSLTSSASTSSSRLSATALPVVHRTVA